MVGVLVLGLRRLLGVLGVPEVRAESVKNCTSLLLPVAFAASICHVAPDFPMSSLRAYVMDASGRPGVVELGLLSTPHHVPS